MDASSSNLSLHCFSSMCRCSNEHAFAECAQNYATILVMNHRAPSGAQYSAMTVCRPASPSFLVPPTLSFAAYCFLSLLTRLLRSFLLRPLPLSGNDFARTPPCAFACVAAGVVHTIQNKQKQNDQKSTMDTGASNQIRQMANFILQEAHEKANEINIKTEHDFNLEKQMLVHAAKLKIQEEYTQKEKDREIQDRM